MKGLLVKDFKLMKEQKNFFIVIVIIAAGMAIYFENPSFIIGYLPFIGSMFTLSTISYDEFDNGNAFLFSLPITRKSYIIEKYGFGLITGICSWFFATVIATITVVVKNSATVNDMAGSALMVLPVIFIMLAFMLPFQLKFGGEKGRIAIICVVGVIFVIGTIAGEIIKMLNINLVSVLDNIQKSNIFVLITAAFGISALVLFISFKTSIAIMDKKEF